ncbi:MAG: lyase family protein [Chloroflexota bacterium]
MNQPSAIFSMLHRTFGDPEMEAIWSETATIEGWLRTEAALSLAQAEVGDLDRAWARAIADACTMDSIDVAGLWNGMANVGYPILGLVRQIAARLPDGPSGVVHWGATTQDIMDTGFALQLGASLDLLDARVAALGDALAAQAERYAELVMAGRTHGQQAVPTTLGAKLAIFLRQTARVRTDLAAVRPEVAQLSMYGAGGSSAGYGANAEAVRAAAARILGLALPDGPRHAARDAFAAYGAVLSRAGALCTRLAREVIDLSRTEIGEIGEASGHHRGASSTMPQKANPIDSEMVLGMAVTAASMSGSLYRAMEVQQERSAGEWQIEWHVLPQISCLVSGALMISARIVTNLAVHPERMAANLAAEQGRTIAEAYMFVLAPTLGRERAHDVVYEAAVRSKREGVDLHEAVVEAAGADGPSIPELTPADWLGDSLEQTRAAIAAWRS